MKIRRKKRGRKRSSFFCADFRRKEKHGQGKNESRGMRDCGQVWKPDKEQDRVRGAPFTCRGAARTRECDVWVSGPKKRSSGRKRGQREKKRFGNPTRSRHAFGPIRSTGGRMEQKGWMRRLDSRTVKEKKERTGRKEGRQKSAYRFGNPIRSRRIRSRSL